MKEKNTTDMARRVLAELSEMTEHASLTGSLRGGERTAARAYNRVLETLEDEGVVPNDMFERLDDQADYGQVGVQCRLLLAVLGDEPESKTEESFGAVVALAPFLKSEDLAQLVRERMGNGVRVPDGLLAGLAPFLGSDMLGDLVRRGVRRPEPPRPPEPTRAPEAPVPTPPPPDMRPVVHAPATLESLAEELRRPDLTVEDRQRIATQLAELAYAQSVQALE